MIGVLFTREDNFVSKVIRLATKSDWSHVDIILPEGNVIGATSATGVAQVSLGERLSQSSAAAVMYIPCPDPELGVEWVKTQLGKPYDWQGLIGMEFGRDWHHEDSWFCSELVIEVLRQSGVTPYRTEILHRIVPHHIWMLNYQITSLK